MTDRELLQACAIARRGDCPDVMQEIEELPAEIEADHRYARKLEERAQWQPIETAPKDGTAVLLWAKDLRFPGRMCVAQYANYDIEWWYVTDGKFGPWPLRGPSPTHWMPLPEIPR